MTTSQPSVGDFVAVYEPLLADGPRDRLDPPLGRDLGHLRVGGAGPRATHRRGQGRRADPRSSTRGRPPAAWAWCPGRRGRTRPRPGRAPRRRPRRAEESRRTLKIWFAVDTLEYLRRGGRIGAARAWIGTTLKIKPILTFEEEVDARSSASAPAAALVRAPGRLRAPAPRGRRRRLGRPAHPGPASPPTGWSRPAGPIFGCDPVFCSELGPVLGAHAGPGLLGVGAVSRSSLGLD